MGKIENIRTRKNSQFSKASIAWLLILGTMIAGIIAGVVYLMW